MKVHIKPQRIIPAEYSIHFYEDRDYKGYIVQSQPYEDRLRPDIEAWLNSNAPGWSVSFDRGDWGEGPAQVEIRFSTEAQAKAFEAQFKNIPCPDALSRGNCLYMRAALRSADGNGLCEHCGYSFRILTIHENGII